MVIKHSNKDYIHSKFIDLLILIRPQQWIKNLFVITPLLFSIEFLYPKQCLKTLLAFISFCLICSSIYVINDLCDREEDRKHKVKKYRPLARGVVGTNKAILISAIVALLGLLFGTHLGTSFIAIILLYVFVGIAYSLWIKHVVIVDVMCISLCFILRILGGCIAIGVTISHWLILCTIMISLFLGFSKRRAEMINVLNGCKQTRKVLRGYSITFLDQVISMLSGAVVICYSLYTVDDLTIGKFGSKGLLLTIPSVLYGTFRYLYIVYHNQEGEDPSNVICSDIPTIINLAVWGIISVFVVYYGIKLKTFI